MVHIFGTEFPHALAMVRAFNKPDKTLVGIQGLCFVCADAYLEGLPENVVKRSTLRDLLKKDSIMEQQKKFYRRGAYEQKALSLTGNVTGRTDWDYHYTHQCNKDVKYFFMNESKANVFIFNLLFFFLFQILHIQFLFHQLVFATCFLKIAS
jgi:hypothetical protein